MARNEDGDESGWGSRTFFASHDDLSEWHFVSEESDQWIYESPKMFRHGSDLYLVARTDPGQIYNPPEKIQDVGLWASKMSHQTLIVRNSS